MNRIKRLALAGALSGLSVTILAGGMAPGRSTNSPCNPHIVAGRCVCVPNATFFGVFKPDWRTWPLERRPDVTFPHAIGAEVLPTPPGEELLPPPPLTKPEALPPVAPAPKGPAEPPGPLPEGPFQIEPQMPGSTGPRDLLPPPAPGGGIPGLFDEGIEEPAEPALPNTLPRTKATNIPDETMPAPPSRSPAAPKASSRSSRLPRLSSADNGAGRDVRPASAAERSEKTSHRLVVQPATMLSARPESQEDSQPAAASDSPSADRDEAGEAPFLTATAALDGFCPVELMENERWVAGDSRWTATYDGLTYRFASSAQQEKFLEGPDRYVPASGGNDPVLAAEGRGVVPGRTDYCMTYRGRLYLFSGEQTLARFQRNPARYARSAAAAR